MTNHDLHTNDEGPRATRPKRRTFTHAYKLRVLQEYDAAPAGEKGALLRREGLYDSSVQLWRKQRDSGALTASSKAKTTAKKKTPEQAELEQLRKEKARQERANTRFTGRPVLPGLPEAAWINEPSEPGTAGQHAPELHIAA